MLSFSVLGSGLASKFHKQEDGREVLSIVGYTPQVPPSVEKGNSVTQCDPDAGFYSGLVQVKADN